MNEGTTPTHVSDGRNFDGAAGGQYDPDLYRYDRIADKISDLDSIVDQHAIEYAAVGFLAVDFAFDEATVEGVKDAFRQILADDSLGADCVQYETSAAQADNASTADQRIAAARKFMNFIHLDDRLRELAQHRSLLRAVSLLMGGREPELFQEMALLKPAGGREKPWHQDRAYFNIDKDHPMVGVWIALDEATIENGCMRMWHGGHKVGPITHFQRRDWQICDTDARDGPRVAVPLKPGGTILFHSLIPHGTPHNATKQSRWAIQLHYYPKDAPRINDQDRLDVFGSEGKDVEC
ncbi:MAG: phytanoyl-CoA hydroxylase [Pirellulaceae bacterium]|jgi:phytanoyl-CoA hydroxylase